MSIESKFQLELFAEINLQSIDVELLIKVWKILLHPITFKHQQFDTQYQAALIQEWAHLCGMGPMRTQSTVSVTLVAGIKRIPVKCCLHHNPSKCQISLKHWSCFIISWCYLSISLLWILTQVFSQVKCYSQTLTLTVPFLSHTQLCDDSN